MKRLALLLLLGAAPPVAAQTASPACPPAPQVFPLAPPDGPLRFTIETDRPAKSGGMRRFALEYRVQFHAVGRGHGMTATLVRIDTPDDMAAGSAMTAIFKPMVGRPLEFFYDANARTLLLRKAEGEALWKLLADEMVARAATAKPGEARDVAAMLLGLPVGQREAMLFADLGQILNFAGRSPGTELRRHPAEPGDGCRTVRLAGNEGWTHGGPGYYSDTVWLVDVETGLVREQREDVTQVTEAAGKPLLVARTVRRLTPE